MKWQIIALRGKRHDIYAGTTYVRADDEDTAKRIGRVVMRRRIRGRFSVTAYPYAPEHDRAMRRYVREVPT